MCFKCGMPGQLLAGRLIRPIALTTFTLDSEVWQTFGSPEVGWPRENDSCMQVSALWLELSDPQTNSCKKFRSCRVCAILFKRWRGAYLFLSKLFGLIIGCGTAPAKQVMAPNG